MHEHLHAGRHEATLRLARALRDPVPSMAHGHADRPEPAPGSATFVHFFVLHRAIIFSPGSISDNHPPRILFKLFHPGSEFQLQLASCGPDTSRRNTKPPEGGTQNCGTQYLRRTNSSHHEYRGPRGTAPRHIRENQPIGPVTRPRWHLCPATQLRPSGLGPRIKE